MSRRLKLGVDGKPLEEQIQAAILDYLTSQVALLRRWKFWRARPSQYIRRQGSGVGFKLHPSEIGMPDIIGSAFGFTVGLEVKRPGNKPSAAQRAWRDDFLRSPCSAYYVVTSLEETIAVLSGLEHASKQLDKEANGDRQWVDTEN